MNEMTLTALSASEDFQNALAEYLPEVKKSNIDFSFYLENRFIDKYCEYCRMPVQVVDFLRETAALIARNKLLKDFFDFCVYHQKNTPSGSPGYTNWPSLLEEAGKHRGAIYMLAAMSIIPEAIEGYRKLNVDESIIRDTMLQFSGFCNNHIQNCGFPGILKDQLPWLRNHRDNIIFRLVRLEFKLRKFHGLAAICRNRSGVTVAFLEDGTQLDHHGYVLGKDNPCPDEKSWHSTFAITDKYISGNPVSPHGYVLRESVSLDLSDWEIIMQPGDMVIDMHIPPGGGLSPDATRNSLNQAAQFFTTRYPEKNLKAIYCRSWIFNTQFEELLPQSNLAEFMRQPYLFPVSCKGDDGMFFVFCTRDYSDIRKFPRQTSLQRAMLEIVESGRKLRSSGMFYLINDLEHFGHSYYRKNFLI
ncbi:MAG: acyltransferase domain-containing protein [Victivallaceae bacterium]|nr:acyltransferase domain-containing protein [Victivallaceae bacterium]MDD3702652.1 acyltransferase domain-containing protein [Victivallaceae bacterium]